MKVRDAHLANEARKQRITLHAARDNKFKIDWKAYTPPKPSFLGIADVPEFQISRTLVPYIDWTPFFQTWEIAGRYPQILTDNKVGAEAKKLFDDAQATAEAHRRREVGDGHRRRRLLAGEQRRRRHRSLSRTRRATRSSRRSITLRQQIARDPSRNRAHTALADFIAPKETGVADYIGGFAVTTGIGEEEAIEATSRRPTTTAASSSRRCATASRKLSPKPCTSKVRRELWGYAQGREAHRTRI